jgi:hypothetical protein
MLRLARETRRTYLALAGSRSGKEEERRDGCKERPGSTTERREQTLAPVTGGGEETREGLLSTIARVARFVNRDRSFFLGQS